MTPSPIVPGWAFAGFASRNGDPSTGCCWTIFATWRDAPGVLMFAMLSAVMFSAV